MGESRAYWGIVTISAQFGAGGSVIGPRVAQALGVPFLDRVLPATVAERLHEPLDAVLPYDWEGTSWSLSRWQQWGLAWVAMAPLDWASPLNEVWWQTPWQFRDQMTALLRAQAAAGGAVILGRAAAVVLADVPNALHVRLFGPAPARVRQASQWLGLTEAEAQQKLPIVDRAREAYVRVLYHADPDDWRWYHLALDTTRIGVEAAVQTIVRLARERAPGPAPAGASDPSPP